MPLASKKNPGEDSDSDGPCQGLLWIQDSATYGTTDNRNVWVFVRGMMVAKNKHDFLPAWAGFISGVYESQSLNPTASRAGTYSSVT